LFMKRSPLLSAEYRRRGRIPPGLARGNGQTIMAEWHGGRQAYKTAPPHAPGITRYALAITDTCGYYSMFGRNGNSIFECMTDVLSKYIKVA